MFAKIWRWLKKLWQQLLGKPPQPSPPGAGTPGGKPNPRLSDAELESLFLQLLDIVEESASRGYIKGFLIAKNIKEVELVAWLRRFGSKLLESPETHRELGRRMVQLGNVAGGELGDVAGKIGRELLGNSETRFLGETGFLNTPVIPNVDKQTANTTNSVYADVPVDGEAVEWFNRGVDEYYAGNIQAALGCFQRAIEISPNYHLAWNGLGATLSDLGQYQKAIEAFQRAIEISPNLDAAWNGLGATLRHLGQYQKAIEAFQRAIDISPNLDAAWNGLGNALNDLGQYQKAIEAFQKAIDISPNFHIAWNGLGATLSDLGQYQKAIEAFQRAIDISPNFHLAWNNLGNALSDLGQYQKAIEAYQRAIEISPNFHLAWNNLGNALKDLGQYQKAIEAYQRAIEISPNFQDAWHNLGLALRDLGQYQQAIEAYNRALEITHNQYWQAWANRGGAIYNLHGYQAALQNWDEGLQSLQPNTRDYQEGCATLHQYKGDAHYGYGKQQPNPHPYWRESRNSYITALKTLSGSQTSILGEVLGAQVSPRFQLLYLKILQNLAKVCNALNYQDDFQLCLDIGDTMLENLLLETDSQDRKIQLAKKFATFSQLRVVLLAQSSQPKEALLLAEKRKNLCLRWLRESRYVGMKDETPLQYPEIEQFLSPGIAAIYWHYSPAAITTFIIKDDGIEIHAPEKPPSPDPFPLRGGRGVREDDDDNFVSEFSLPIDIEGEKPPSPDPFPLRGGRGVREDDDDNFVSEFSLPIDIEAEKPPSPDPFPLRGGRGVREDDDDNSVTPLSLQSGNGKPEIQTQTEETIYTLTPLSASGRGWGRGSAVKQLQEFEDWLKAWKEDYQNNRKDPKNAKEEKGSWREKMADRLDDLGKILDVEGILNKIGDDITDLILIPHRDLHLLPLHYLWREKGFTITYLPSLKVGIDLQTDTPSTPQKLLSIESPSPLEFAETESQIIAQIYDNPTRIKSSKATKNTVIAAFTNSADIFHFTGHGEHNIHQPLDSALELANQEKLTLQDIFQLNLKCYQLACLSACETGITSKQGIIDEYVGLVSGFLAKGVTHVVSTLWQVGETETALMMIKFHQLYKDNIPPALALQQAQTWLSTLTFTDLIQWYSQESAKVEEYSGCWESLQGAIIKAQQEAETKGMNYRPYAHPYYWAGFIVSGNHLNCFGVGTRHN